MRQVAEEEEDTLDHRWDEMTWPEYPSDDLWEDYDDFTNSANEGGSINMAFEILTLVCPSRCKKWAQPPDMVSGTDLWSWRRATAEETSGNIVRADDFVSDGRPICDIHWWGSYSNWWYETDGSLTNPVPPPSDPTNRPTGFVLSWHWATDGSLPGEEITNIFLRIDDCHEVYYGTVTQDWVQAGYLEHEYQYYADLLDPDVSGEPWLELQGTHYWLNIQAVFDDNFEPSENVHGGWGWKTTAATTHCSSVFSTNLGKAWLVQGPKKVDLSFELTTTNIPGTGTVWATDVVFTDIDADISNSLVTMWTTGYCGCGKQVLQESPDLLATNPTVGGWRDSQTNPVPRSWNIWQSSPIWTQRLYRVIQKN